MQNDAGASGPSTNPLVSVILPIGKDHPFLDLAVQSILDQTYANLELLLIANGCSDADWNALQRFSSPRVRLVRTRVHQLPFALNLGIHLSRGKLIARMDSDDLAHPRRLAKQVERFNLEPGLTVLGTRYELMDDKGDYIGGGPPLPCTNAGIRRRLPFRCPIAHPTAMFRKSAIEKVGGYMYGSPSEDYDLWLRLSRDATAIFGAIAEPLLRYRVHDAQETAPRNSGKLLAYDCALKMREFLLTGRIALLVGALYSVIIFLGSPVVRRLRALRA
ncbi:MAG: glycosyltransferase [Gammaproteobacteria bacterium]